MALYFNLIPEELKAKAIGYLINDIKSREWHLSTGIHGTHFLNPVLTETGNNNIAYKLLLNDTVPSLGYTVKCGATTIWERWDTWTEENGFQDPGMNSFNHYTLGSIGEWLYNYAAGIRLDPEISGYKKILIKPCPEKDLDFVKAEYQSINGLIKSWWQIKGNSFFLDVTIPVNTTAEVFVPSNKEVPVIEGDIPAEKSIGVTKKGTEDSYTVYNVESGTYHFKSTI